MNYERTDWNCRLLPGMHEGTESVEEAVSVLQKIEKNYGITRFCMMPEYDPTRESVRAFLLRRQNAEERLRNALPENIQVRVSAALLLSPECSELTDLEKLTVLPGILPLRPPISSWKDWMDAEMNHLLFKRRLTPLFLSFELSSILYPPEILKKLTRIPHSVFQFSFRSLADSGICRLIRSLLQEDHTVLLGSGIRHVKKAEDYDIEHYLFHAADFFSAAECDLLLKSSLLFWKKKD